MIAGFTAIVLLSRKRCGTPCWLAVFVRSASGRRASCLLFVPGLFVEFIRVSGGEVEESDCIIMAMEYPVGDAVEEAGGVQLGDLLEGERVQALLRLDSASVAPEVLVAVGPSILAVEDVPWILGQYGRRGGSRRELRREGVLAQAARLGLRPSAREWFWPVWLAAQDLHEHNYQRRWGDLTVCLNFCGFSEGGGRVELPLRRLRAGFDAQDGMCGVCSRM